MIAWVRIKGERSVALVTGEEKILPPDARWFCCTAESRCQRTVTSRSSGWTRRRSAPIPERGHVFTDRLLHARGREETMILGSATLAPVLKALVPKVEIVSRPRFSTLSYAGVTKLSRLPPRLRDRRLLGRGGLCRRGDAAAAARRVRRW